MENYYIHNMNNKEDLCESIVEHNGLNNLEILDLTLDQAKEEILKLNKEIFLLKRKLEEKGEGNIRVIFC